MSLVTKNWHENVNAALDMVREEVKKAEEQIEKAGGAEMASGNRVLARKALDYLDTLDEFMGGVENLGGMWESIRNKIDEDNPGVQEIVLPTKVREVKSGFTCKRKNMAPWTNFTATVKGGEIIHEETAKAGFAKALGYFNLDELAKSKETMNGEPLISKSRADFVKYSKDIAEVRDGWLVNTHCSTAMKVQLLRKLEKQFKIGMKVNVVPHKNKGVAKPIVEDKPKDCATDGKDNSPPNDKGVEGKPYIPVGRVVQAVFPEVFRRNLVTKEDVAFLLSNEASKTFKCFGYAVLKPDRGRDEDRYDRKHIGRYYPSSRVSLAFGKKRYYLSNQFKSNGLSAIVAWLEGKGISKQEICELVERMKNPNALPGLF